jgi:cytochrome P450
MIQKMAQSGEAFKLEDIALRTTFDVIGKATFGHSLNAKSEGSKALEYWENMSRAFASTRHSNNLVHNFLANRVVKREAKKLDAVLAEMIRKRFDIVVQGKTNLSDKKNFCIMDLILRDYMEEMFQSGKKELDSTFLKTAIIQVKTLLVGGTGTTADVICFSMMM